MPKPSDAPAKPDTIKQAPVALLAAPIKAAAPKNLQQATKVSLTVYLQLAKIPPDQAAGFTLYTLGHKTQPQSMAQWKRMHDAFNKRPI